MGAAGRHGYWPGSIDILIYEYYVDDTDIAGRALNGA